MLVGFNPYTPSNKSNRQSPTFRGSVKDLGTINPVKIVQSVHALQECGVYIQGGAYRPTHANLQALLDAIQEANKNQRIRVALIPEIKENIQLLIKKAQEQGVFGALNGLIPKVQGMGINL